MIDYRGMYEDLLAMERRAFEAGKAQFADSCRQFRLDLLIRFYNPIGHVPL